MTKRQFWVLYRDFLLRIVDPELLSLHARGDASTLLGQVVSLLIFLSLLFSVPALYFSGKMAVPGQEFLTAVWSLQHFLIATTMLLVGLFAVLTWNSTFPDKRDLMILAPLPVRTRTLFLAKIASTGTALALLLFALHAMAGIVWPLAFNRHVPTQLLTELAPDPAMPPVPASGIESVMDHDLRRLQQSGILAHQGVAIGVLKHGVPRVFAYGTAKVDSIFEIGSVTKTFTGLVLAQMVEEGRVTLDEPVRLLLPPGIVETPASAEITLLDLATHHSGLPRMPGDYHPKKEDNRFADLHTEDLYDFIARHGVAKPPDSVFLYSNVGVGLLGELLAARAHMSYADLLKTEVTGPLGLEDTVMSLSPEQRTRFVQGHNGFSDGPDGFRRSGTAYGKPIRAMDFDAIAAAGALRSTAGDLLTYLEANLHPATRGPVLSRALLLTHMPRAEMSDSAVSAEIYPPGTRIGLLWWRTADGCYVHGGATQGYTAAVLFHPKQDWAIAVLSNTGPGGLLSSDLIAQHIRQRLLGLPALSLAPVKVPASGGPYGLIRLFGVYWLTMLAAGGFVYCCVLALQGLAAELLPHQAFLRASSFLQLAVFCLLMAGYFLQPVIAAPNLFDANNTGPPGWSPSYWFLGLFQQLNGSPALALFAARARIGLAIAVGSTAAAYTMCYFRSLRRIVEQPDIAPGRLRFTERKPPLSRFGTSLQTAIVQFSIRTLMRSRQHRVILAFYLGIGFGTTVFLLKSPLVREISATSVTDPWHTVSVPLLAASIILTGFWIIGVRAVFSLPLELPANWIFRVTPLRAGSNCVKAVRRSLWMLSVAPALVGSSIVFLALWPWRAAMGHLVLLALLGVTITEFCLQGTPKIPFTCSWLPGKSNFHIVFWMCILVVLAIVLEVAELERRALANPLLYAVAVTILGVSSAFAAWRTSKSAAADIESLHFEELPSWQLTTLDLSK